MTTIKVKMENTESGRYPGFFKGTGQFHCLEGHKYDVPEKLARSWIDQGVARRVPKTKKESS